MFIQVLQQIKAAFVDAIEFRSRIWVVNISEGVFRDESFVVNEDNFQEPLHWMKKKEYTAEMLNVVDKMKRSQVKVFRIGSVEHRLLRVK